MTVAQFGQTNYNTQSGTAYPLQIDANFAVLEQIGAQFAPHAAATPNMTMLVDAGTIFAGGTVTEVAQQTTPTFTAPTGNPRIDRVVVSQSNGAISVVTGTPAASPVAPAIPSGYAPCAQVSLQTSTTAIADSMITDERSLGSLGLGTAAYQAVGTSGSAVPLLDGANTWSAQQSFSDPVAAPGMAASGTELLLQNNTLINCTDLAGTANVPVQAAPAANASQLVQLGQMISNLAGGSGYLEIPIWTGGALFTFILQWKTGSQESVSSGTSLDLSLDWDISFPHGCLFALAGTYGGVLTAILSTYTASSVSFILFNPTNSTETSAPIAIGIGY